MATQPKKLAPVVAVLNMKGGVGKTTISAHVFRVLYHRLQQKTLLVDFDPQFNLTQTVISRKLYDGFQKQNKTIMAVMEPPPVQSIFNITQNLGPPPKTSDVSIGLRHIPNTEINLHLVPGDFRLVKYSLIDDPKHLNPIKKRFSDFIENARREYDVVCIDCNPSSSFMTLCALTSCTHLLVPVRPDRYSVLGLELLDQYVSSIPAIVKKPQQIVLVNGVPTQKYDGRVEAELRANPVFGPRTMTSTLTKSSILEANPGYTGFATDKKVPHKGRLYNRIASVVDELGGILGI